MDRNSDVATKMLFTEVATREGDVDRNNKMEVGIEDANRRHP